MRLAHFYKLVLQAYPVLKFPDEELAKPTPVAFIVQKVRADLRHRLKSLPFVQRVVAVAVWPVMAALSAVYLLALNGLTVQRRTGRPIARQFRDQIDLAFRCGIHPSFYYMYALYDGAQRAGLFEYLPKQIVKPNGAYARVYDQHRGYDRARVLSDKRRFFDLCRANDLPTPAIYAEFSGGVAAWRDAPPPALPERNIFVKPQRAKGGRGTDLWSYANGHYTNSKGVRLDPPSLLRHLCDVSTRKTCPYGRAETWLAVEHCVNHAELRDLTTGALNTLRIVTCLNERGVPEHIFSMFRMAQNSAALVDNCHAGGLAALVDPATGTLGPATGAGVLVRLGWLDHHPVTGATITGRTIPFWEETLELALICHRCLGEVPFVGWDIAVLQSGPSLIEGNKTPSIEIAQRVAGPMGNGRFGELLVHQMRTCQKPG
jgi:hypothetical protein